MEPSSSWTRGSHRRASTRFLKRRRTHQLRACWQSLNAPDGYTWTAKCDAWSLGPEEITAIAQELDTEPAPAGFGSYIDLLLREHAGFWDFRTHERTVRAWTHAAAEASDRARAGRVCHSACAPGGCGGLCDHGLRVCAGPQQGGSIPRLGFGSASSKGAHFRPRICGCRRRYKSLRASSSIG